MNKVTRSEKTMLIKQKTGKTLREVAKDLGYTETMLCLVCGGKVKPSWELARALAKLTGESAEYFLP
jgi:DNA-binding XRE family transcriptional regulator